MREGTVAGILLALLPEWETHWFVRLHHDATALAPRLSLGRHPASFLEQRPPAALGTATTARSSSTSCAMPTCDDLCNQASDAASLRGGTLGIHVRPLWCTAASTRARSPLRPLRRRPEHRANGLKARIAAVLGQHGADVMALQGGSTHTDDRGGGEEEDSVVVDRARSAHRRMHARRTRFAPRAPAARARTSSYSLSAESRWQRAGLLAACAAVHACAAATNAPSCAGVGMTT